MRQTEVIEVRVDERGRMCVSPREGDYARIYRAAAEVRWDSELRFLHSPVPREWSLVQWYRQIGEALRDEYGEWLTLTADTRWVNVNEADRTAIEQLVLGPR